MLLGYHLEVKHDKLHIYYNSFVCIPPAQAARKRLQRLKASSNVGAPGGSKAAGIDVSTPTPKRQAPTPSNSEDRLLVHTSLHPHDLKRILKWPPWVSNLASPIFHYLRLALLAQLLLPQDTASGSKDSKAMVSTEYGWLWEGVSQSQLYIISLFITLVLCITLYHYIYIYIHLPATLERCLSFTMIDRDSTHST